MPLYEMTPNAFRPLSKASFTGLMVRERDDLQRLLRSQIEVLGDDLYVKGSVPAIGGFLVDSIGLPG